MINVTRLLTVVVAALAILVLARPAGSLAADPIFQPTIAQATGKMNGAMHKACLKVEVTVTLRGIPVGTNGKCKAYGTIPWSPSYDLDWTPAWAHGGHALRLWVTGYIEWETQPYSFTGPCFDQVLRKPFGGTLIKAHRDGYVWITPEGQLALRLAPWGWGCPDGNRA